MSSESSIPELYRHEQFYGRRKVLNFVGASFHLRTLDDRLLAFSRQKAFKLKEDIRVFADEEMTDELLVIQADRVIDFSASYKVLDARTREHYGTLRRKGFSSMFRDTWEIVDPDGNVRGRVLEDSQWKALVRRFIDYATLLLPQAFNLEVDGRVVATMKQNRNPFAPRVNIDLGLDPNALPRPLAIATVVLLLAVEGRQA
jgi:hypothetical protein